MTVGDLRCSLDIENDPAVLRRALVLLETRGSGYGSGVSARRMITARLNKLAGKVKP